MAATKWWYSTQLSKRSAQYPQHKNSLQKKKKQPENVMNVLNLSPKYCIRTLIMSNVDSDRSHQDKASNQNYLTTSLTIVTEMHFQGELLNVRAHKKYNSFVLRALKHAYWNVPWNLHAESFSRALWVLHWWWDILLQESKFHNCLGRKLS